MPDDDFNVLAGIKVLESKLDSLTEQFGKSETKLDDVAIKVNELTYKVKRIEDSVYPVVDEFTRTKYKLQGAKEISRIYWIIMGSAGTAALWLIYNIPTILKVVEK